MNLKLQSELCFYIFYFSSDFPFQIFIPSSIISSLFSFHLYFLQYFLVFLFLFLFPSIIPNLQIKMWRNILLFFLWSRYLITFQIPKFMSEKLYF